MADPERRIAFCGLGIMGSPMAANLVRAGYELSVWTHTPGKADRFASEHGARAAASPREAAEGADLVITMVVDAPEVEAVLDEARPDAGSLVIDMTTIAPSESRRLAERMSGRGVAFLDAPVSGSRPKAEDGTLTIMVGGDSRDYDRAHPALEAMGELIRHVGPQGHGSMLKLITNSMAAVNAAALAQGLALARGAELDPEAFLEVAPATAAGSTMLTLKGRPMVDRDFQPLFKLGHMLKDVRHCLAEAEALGLGFPLAAAAEPMYARASERGHGEEDFAAVVTEAANVPDGT